MRMLAAALLATVSLAVPATAAAPARPSCHLVKDTARDAVALAAGLAAAGNDDALDVIELDLATKGKDLTAVVRAYALDKVDTQSPTGRLFTFAFTVRGAPHTVRMLLDMTGGATSDVGAVPNVDAKAYELRLTAPLASLGLPALTARDRFTRLDATTARWAGDLATGHQVGDVVDTAGGPVSYVHLGRSCVAVGA